MLPKSFKPVFIDNNLLTRAGPSYDGGYIITKNLIDNIENIITFGLSDEWLFEKKICQKKPDIFVYAFDHTVNKNFWLERLKKDLIHLLLLKKLRLKKIINIFKFFDYIYFFDNKKKFHIQKKIGTSKGDYDLKFIISNFLKNKKNYLLKIDIEGDEYNIINQILDYENTINCLLIEFHDIHLNNNKNIIENFINNLNELKLVHIHGNNCAVVDSNNDPTVIEMSFINKKFIENYKLENPKKYPISSLDKKNKKRNPEIDLNFEE